MEPSQNAVRVWTRLVKASQVSQAQIESALRDAGFPPLAWYDVLLELERARETGLRPLELQRRLLIVQYNLSRLLDRIEAAGYLRRSRCAEDGRGQIVTLTETGFDLRQRMWPVYAAAIEAAAGSRLSAKEAEELIALLERLAHPKPDRPRK